MNIIQADDGDGNKLEHDNSKGERHCATGFESIDPDPRLSSKLQPNEHIVVSGYSGLKSHRKT